MLEWNRLLICLILIYLQQQLKNAHHLRFVLLQQWERYTKERLVKEKLVDALQVPIVMIQVDVYWLGSVYHLTHFIWSARFRALKIV